MKKYVFVALGLVTAMAQAADVSVAAAPQAAIPAARGPALELALEAAREAIAHCAAIEQKVAVSVVDSAGVLKVLLAADGASARGVLSGNNKAVTALTFKAATSALAEQVKSDQELAGKFAANPNYAARAGGLLIRVNDEVIGAIGVGGARGSEKAAACAVAGLQKVQARLQ